MTEDLRRKVEIKGSKRKEMINFFSSSNPLVFRVKMNVKVKKIRQKLDDIATDRRNFQFIERVIDTQSTNRLREQTHSFVRSSDVIGRENDKRNIVELLLSSSCSISVLPIVGLGRLGKTTLAKLVYNDDRIVENFETRIWVCVSEDFDLTNLMEKIIRAVCGNNNANMDLDQLQTCVRNHLGSKKFLLVLDDVWNEDRKRWMDMRDLLDCGAEGSTIVVTTRSKTIGAIMGTFPSYDLKGLSNDECLSIFLRCAFKEGEEKEHPKLVEIGKAIAHKCGGLPLAVRTLGSLLYTKTEEREWLYIKDDEIWKIAQKDNDILPILKLSFDEMPMHLKQCFAYCSIFPKDTLLHRVRLINHWIAHGFIQSTDGTRQIEDIGNQYFNELLSRSFFQDVEVGFDCEVLTCKMHDLVHDLAQSVAGKEVSSVNFDTENISERCRHMLFCADSLWEREFPRHLLELKKLRSFSFSLKVGPISKPFLVTLLRTFNGLRVLDLSESWFDELPSFVGTLKHLRYFSLRGNITIKALPNSVSNLLNLQTFDLSYCWNLINLPRDMGNMWNLRHLYVTAKITSFPEEGMEGLSSLQSLCITRCDYLKSLSMGLRNLTSLRALSIDFCPSLTDLPESMSHLSCLEKLTIRHCDELIMKEEGLEGLRALQSLAIHDVWYLYRLPDGLQHAAATLKYLSIKDCHNFATWPTWLIDLISLIKLEVVSCWSMKTLPPAPGMDRLKALQFLHIQCPDLTPIKCSSRREYLSWVSSRISEIPAENDLPRDMGNMWNLRHLHVTAKITSFPEEGMEGLSSLQSLCITRCDYLNSLSMGLRNLKSLRALTINMCRSLTELPESMSYLSSLEKLTIRNCRELRIDNGGLRGLRALQSLAIHNILHLYQLPDGLQHAAATLKYLSIKYCHNFATWPTWLIDLTSLIKLEVVDCGSISTLPPAPGMDRLKELQFFHIDSSPFGSPSIICSSRREYLSWVSSRISEIPAENDEISPGTTSTTS